MFEIIRPEKDTTIYGYIPRLNAGIDEILELNTSGNSVRVDEDVSNPVLASRILLDFEELDEDFNKVGIIGTGTPNVFAELGVDTTTTSGASVPPNDDGVNVFAEFGIDIAPERSELEPETQEQEDDNADVWLRLFFAEGRGLQQKYDIEVFPLEEGWREGLGRRNNDPNTQVPANWIERREGIDWSSRGGSFDTSISVSETFDINDSPDIFFKVNKLFNEADLDNGIILKRSDEDLNRSSQLSFFSRNTNTVFVPHLLVGTETFTYDVPEDAEEFTETESMSVFITNLRESYNSDARVRFRIKVREKFPERPFLGIRPRERRERRQDPTPEPFLPRRTLFYEIRDSRTDEPIHPFSDPYTTVSYNSGEHFFDVDLSNLFPRRPYEILFKFVDPETGNEQIFSPEQTFRIDD